VSNNPVFKQIVIKDVKLQYPRLDTTYRYNSQEMRSEQCPQQAQGASWSISWEVPESDARDFYKELRQHFEECRKNDSSLPEFSKVFGMKKNDDGTVLFRAKKNGTNRNGGLNKEPMVVDGAKKPLENRAFWSGSKGSVKVIAFPSKDPSGGGGISLLLEAVQVVEPLYNSDDLDGFDVVDTPNDNGKDPFDITDQSPPEKKLKTESFEDDEIPF